MKITGLQKTSLIDYPGYVAAIVFTQGCPWRCGYCHNPELNAFITEGVALLPDDEVLAFLAKRRGVLDGLVITGGEPTSQPDLLDFMKQVKALGLLVKLDTNGVAPSVVEQAIQQHLVDYLAMDIKAPLGKYAVTVGRPVVDDNIRRSIQLIMGSGVDYEFRSTILPALHTADDVIAMAQLVSGARRYYLQKFRPMTKLLNPAFEGYLAFSDDDMRRLAESCRPYVAVCDVRL